MMKLLAIETATEACSAALYLDGEILLRHQVKPRGHSELILGMMDELLAESELSLNALDALAFGRGPGSFTGVRIATGVIQGVAFGADLPVAPVSTLAALAQRCYREQEQKNLLAAFDARMQEIYWGAYRINEAGLAESVSSEQVVRSEIVSLPAGESWFGVGSGWLTYGESLQSHLGSALVGFDPNLLCSAHDVAVLGVEAYQTGRVGAAEEALPVYLRDQVAVKKAS